MARPNHSSSLIALVVSKFNPQVTRGLLDCCVEELTLQGVRESRIKTFWVPGTYELPFMALQVAKTKKFEAVICLGCVIKGDTSHDLHVAHWASLGIGQVSLMTGVPTLFGVLTPKTERQALKRSQPGALNRGKEVAQAALQMISLLKKKKGNFHG